MKSGFAALSILLYCVSAPAQAQPYSPESFAAELDNLERSLDQGAAPVAAGLPEEWEVNTATHSYSIPSDALKTHLRESKLDSARDWIAQTRNHVQSFIITSPQNSARDKEALRAILARPEFKDVAPPNMVQRWMQSLQAWINQWLSRIFQLAAQHPTGSQVLFWTVISAAVLALGFWLYNLFERTDRIPTPHDPPSLEHKLLSWQEWLLAARDAAAKGDHRQAIRNGYWVAIARLQQDRAARINFTDTPRERLRLLAQSSRKVAALPATQLEPLSRITTSLERFWYAKLPVNADDVAQSFENLEALGCKAD